MKKFVIFLSTLALFLSLQHQIYAAESTPSAALVEDEIIVTIKSDTTTSNAHPIAQAVAAEVQKELLLKGTFVLKVPHGSVQKVLNTLAKMPHVATASPNYTAQKLMATNDEAITKQWALFKIQAANATAQSAWDTTAGKPEVKVAVLDTGINKNHPDLNGKVLTEKNFSGSPDAVDRDGHGTLVAGIIGATADNQSGIAGVAYNTSLMSVKVLDDGGSGNYSDIIDGIIWATDNGAQIINLSLGGPATIPALEEAVAYATSKGVVVVAAAGNSGSTSPMYPAYYADVLSVAATDEDDKKITMSNHGTWVKLAAPGGMIYSTHKDTYSYASGTSVAAPHVSGLAALILSTNICNTSQCVAERIEKTADQIQGTGSQWKNGRINAFRALTEQIAVTTPAPTVTATPSVPPPPAPSLSISPTPTAISTPTPAQTAHSITVGAIEMTATKRGSRNDVMVKIQIKNGSNPVSAARVAIELKVPSGKVYEGTQFTTTQGLATFALRNSAEIGTFNVKVTNVSKSGYTYIPSLTTQTLKVQ